MKTIKFRGKCLDTGEWVYGYVIKYLTGKCSMYEPVISSVSENDTYEYDVIPETVGQFTGLHDKNGREIYEGDIILWRDDKLEIKFQDGAFLASLNENGYISDFYLKNITCLCVIGNVFDNSELLKGGEQ